MTTPDEDITMRKGELDSLYARIAEKDAEIYKLQKRNNSLAHLWVEAREQAEEWRNEAVNGDKNQCARLEEPLPWEPKDIYGDVEDMKEAERHAREEAGWRNTDKFRIDEL